MHPARAALAAALSVSLLGAAPAPRAQEPEAARAQDTRRDLDRARHRSRQRDLDPAERMRLEQDLRDIERRSSRTRGDQRGYDRSRIREMRERLDEAARDSRETGPAFGGQDRDLPPRSRRLRTGVPEVDVDPDVLEGK